LRRLVLLCVASCSFAGLVSAGFAADRDGSSTSPGDTAAETDCAKATALQVATPLHLVDTTLPNPIAGVLCGAFAGPGSQVMVATFAQGTCLPNNGWAVFTFTGGAWQLVPNGYHAGFVAALTAVGSDIRQTVPVWRKSDGPCHPTGGTKTRIWHWDGTRFVAGPWKQVTKGEPGSKYFYSPSHNIFCGMHDDSDYRSVFCQSWKSPQRVELHVNGTLKICQGRRCIPGVCGCREEAPTLGYGKQGTVGRFRCVSLQSGMRCTVIRSGKGFLINSTSVHRVGA
jgi:hypothetical protein